MMSLSATHGFDAFPGEVKGHIFDFLHNDIDSLKACALVSHAWTPYSHTHLFSTFTYHPDNPRKTIGEVSAWATQVAPYITALVVRPSKAALLSPKFWIKELQLLMTFIPNVRRVTLEHVSIHSEDGPASVIQSAAHRWSIAQLSIMTCKTQDNAFHPIAHLLSLFSTIDQLQFAHTVCSWDPALESTPCFTSLLSGLRINEVSIYCQDERPNHSGYTGLCRIFERAEPPWPLRRLVLTLPRMPQTPSLARFLSRCTRTLVELRVDVVASMLLHVTANTPITAPVQWHTRVLKECSQLETMRLNFLTLSDIDNVRVEAALHAAYNDILDANVELVLCAPPQLQTIIIAFSHVGTWDARVVDVLRGLSAWRRLDTAILRLRHLKKVVCTTSKHDGLNVAAQLASIHSTTGTSSPSYRLASLPESCEDEYVGILVNGLPGVASANLLRIAVVSHEST